MKKIIVTTIAFLMTFISAVTVAGDKKTPETMPTSIEETTAETTTTKEETTTTKAETTTTKEETTTTKAETTTTKTKTTTTTTKEEEYSSYSDYELELLAHLVYGESGSQSDECQIAVASVILNRVNAREYPSSIESVIYQRGQYACTWDGNFDRTPSKRAYSNARYVLEHGSQIPSNVIYQAQFNQGSGVYDIIDGEYFCYR